VSTRRRQYGVIAATGRERARSRAGGAAPRRTGCQPRSSRCYSAARTRSC